MLRPQTVRSAAITIAAAVTAASATIAAGAAVPQQAELENPVLQIPAQAKAAESYTGYIITKHEAGNGVHVQAMNGQTKVADFDVIVEETPGKVELTILADTPVGPATITKSVIGAELSMTFDGVVVASATASKLLKNGTPVFADIALDFYAVAESLEAVKAIALIAPALNDPGLQAIITEQTAAGQATGVIFGPVTPVACNAQECDNLYPGQGPFDKARNCICQCCIDEGGCFVYVDTFYGGDIGCSGAGIIGGAAFLLCSAICVPTGPFL